MVVELVVVVETFSPVAELVDALVVVVFVTTALLPVSTGGSVELVVFSPTVVVVVVVFVELLLVLALVPPPQAVKAKRLAETSAVEMIFMCIPLLNMRYKHGPAEHDLATRPIVRCDICKLTAFLRQGLEVSTNIG